MIRRSRMNAKELLILNFEEVGAGVLKYGKIFRKKIYTGNPILKHELF